MTDAELTERFDQLQTGMDAMVRSLSLVNGTLETHSEMLAAIMEAATEEPESSPLHDVLAKIAVILDTQTESLVRIGGMMDALGPTIQTAMMQAVHRAVHGGDEDGVVP